MQNDASFAREIEKKKLSLASVEISSDGRIMEWSREYREARPYHRHVSHLWGVYPGNLTVDLAWSEGKLQSWHITGKPGVRVNVVYAGKKENIVL